MSVAVTRSESFMPANYKSPVRYYHIIPFQFTDTYTNLFTHIINVAVFIASWWKMLKILIYACQGFSTLFTAPFNISILLH